jgi:peptidoglycan DL-endopeptidase CwlO
LKEEQFLRYLFAAGVMAFFIAGSSAIALAGPADSAQPSAATTTAVTGAAAASSATATATATVTVPATAAAPSGADTAAEPGTPVDSPDVAEWTAQLIHEQQAQAVHKTAHGPVLGRFASRLFARTTSIARNLTRDALRFLGTPYVFGGTTSSGFDCSGFVQHVFAMLGVTVPRTADAQYYAGRRAKGGIRVGDLVFFQTYEPGPSHVGIYLGHGKFVHASSHGVMVSSLSDSYWSERYLGAKRVIAQR